MKEIVIIGAGHNGLVAAFYLARAGYRPVVLEARAMVGGAAVTEEIAPGHRGPTLAHSTGPVHPAIAADMQLSRRVEFLRPDPRLVALSPGGRPLVLSTDAGRSSEAIRPHSVEDAARYPGFAATLERLGGFILPLLERTPPSLDAPGGAELWDLLKTGRRFRRLGKQDAFRLLRWMPMAVADLVGEWFESDALRGALAARGTLFTAMGPWSAGTALALLPVAPAGVPIIAASAASLIGLRR